jgi:hypothetical protein
MSSHIDIELGTDDRLTYQIVDADDPSAAIDVSAWTLSFMVKRDVNAPDASALLTKTSASGVTVEGTYAPLAGDSTQMVVVTIQDTNTDALKSGHAIRELKRMGNDVEQILHRGPVRLIRTVHHA